MKLSQIYSNFYKNWFYNHLFAFFLLLFHCSLYLLIPNLIDKIFNYAFINRNIILFFQNIIYTFIIYLFIFTIEVIFERIMITFFIYKPLNDIRGKLVKKYFYLPINFYYNNASGSISNNILTNLNQATMTFYNFAKNMSLIIKIIVLIIIIFKMNYIYIIPYFLCNGILLSLIIFFRKKEIKIIKNQYIVLGDLCDEITDILEGEFDIYSNNLYKFFFNKSKKNINNGIDNFLEKRQIYSYVESNLVFLIQKILPILIIVLIYYTNVNKIFSISNFLSFYLIYLAMPDLKNLSILKQNIEKTKTSWKPIINILEEKEEKIKDKIPSNFEYSLVNLSIIVRNNKIIDGVNLNIKKGEKLVITGESGEGKSVLLNSLIGNFYEKSGNILIGNINIDEINLFEYRKSIGYLDEEPIIFEDSIYNNIILNLKIEKSKIKYIIDKLKLTDFFSRFLDIDQKISDSSISAGEKEVIGFLRIFIREPKVIFLDEATSSLDPKLEHKILSIIKMLSSTVIAISHRFSALNYFDRIVYLSKGKIIEDISSLNIEKSNYIKNLFKDQIAAYTKLLATDEKQDKTK